MSPCEQSGYCERGFDHDGPCGAAPTCAVCMDCGETCAACGGRMAAEHLRAQWQQRAEKAEAENAALRAALGFMPLSLREAVARGDVDACARMAADDDAFVVGLQDQSDRLRAALEKAMRAIGCGCCARGEPQEALEVARAALAGVKA